MHKKGGREGGQSYDPSRQKRRGSRRGGAIGPMTRTRSSHGLPLFNSCSHALDQRSSDIQSTYILHLNATRTTRDGVKLGIELQDEALALASDRARPKKQRRKP